MAEETSINIGGVWKAIDDCKVNIGGVWKQVETISVNIGGTWKEVWANFTVSLGGGTSQGNNFSGGSASAGWRTLKDGELQRMVGGVFEDFGTEWGDPVTTDVGANYWVRVTQNTGDTPTVSSGFGTWLQMNTTRTWSWTQSGIGNKDANLTIEIATDSGGSNVIASGTYIVDVNVESGA